MGIQTDDYRVAPGHKIKLKNWPTDVKPLYRDEADYTEKLAAHVERLSEMQNLLYAHNRYALLLIFQAMDAAGKDSVIKHVMSGVNPQGVARCSAFKHAKPARNSTHNFLWRVSQGPARARGMIGIFNRSHYEDVLVPRVAARDPDWRRCPSRLGPYQEEALLGMTGYAKIIAAFERHLAR